MLDKVVDELLNYDITDVSIFKPSYKKEITSYLIDNSVRFDLLIIFGGDGTFNEVINGLMILKDRPKILYVPTGTVNDLGKYLNLPNNYKRAFRLLNESLVKIDLCKVNDTYFSYVLACGKFTDVSYGMYSKKYKKMFGKFYYYLKALKDLFRRRIIDLSINHKKSDKYSLVLFLNIWRVGNFKIRWKNKDKLNDGKINVVLFKNTIFFDIVALFMFLVFGILLTGVAELISGNEFSIKTIKSQQFNTDGEESYNTNNLRVVVVKEALNMYVSNAIKEKYF